MFNALTGLRQKTGNYPGVTTEIHAGSTSLKAGQSVDLLDLPGAYSLYPNTSDEFELVKLILGDQRTRTLDLVVYVADVTELDKQLLLLTQLLDLGLPCVMVLSMVDKLSVADAKSIRDELESFFGISVFLQQPGDKQNVNRLKSWLAESLANPMKIPQPHYSLTEEEINILADTEYPHQEHNLYYRLLHLHHQHEPHVPTLVKRVRLIFPATG